VEADITANQRLRPVPIAGEVTNHSFGSSLKPHNELCILQPAASGNDLFQFNLKKIAF
tara:strand:+ start:291 stop:464 length:174 start_codon:yes stop_codon:yes gene_type:complete